MIDFNHIDDLARRLSQLVPPGLRESQEELQQTFKATLQAGLAKLGAMLQQLKPAGEPIPDDPAYRARQLYADVAIFHRAVRVALDDQEFFDPREIDAAKKLLVVGGSIVKTNICHMRLVWHSANAVVYLQCSTVEY